MRVQRTPIGDTTLTKNNHKVDADLLFQKSKQQKIAAWILLGAGVGLVMVGSNIASNGNLDNIGSGLVIMIGGGAALITSVPLFISSAKNKRKANLMLKDENVFFNPQLNIKEHLIAVGVKINL